MRLSLFFIALVALLSIHAANSYQLTYSDYAKLPEKSMVVISPSATKLAYRQVSDGRDLIIVLDLISGEYIRAASIDGINPDNVYFIDDNRLILVASKNTTLYGYRGRHDVSVAFSFDIKTGEMHQLMTAGYGLYQGQAALGSIVGISSDRKFAYMPAWHTQSRYSLLKVDLTNRKKPRQHKRGTRDTIDFFVGDNGELLARERFNNKTNLHTLEALQDGSWVKIFKDETEIRHVSFVGVTPDKKSLVMIKQDSSHGRWAYYTLRLKDGEISKPIFSKEDRDVEAVLTDINRVVYGVRFSGFKPSYEFFNEKLNKRMRGIEAVLPEFAITINDYTPDWTSIVFHIDGAGSSGQYIRYQDGELDLLAHARPNIKSVHVNPIKQRSIIARDGLEIPTLVTLPKGKELKKLPAIMLPHGGPESYDKVSFDWLAQYFSSQGYLVIQPQFRGSSGFGAEHLQKGRGEWGRKMQNDLTDALSKLVDEGLVNPEQVCIVGASYGGYAALAGAAFTPDLYKCVIAINGVADIPSMLNADRRKYGGNHWVVSYWDRVISNGNLEEDHLEKISPINYIDKITAPILLIHSEHDMIVPFNQSEEMFDELEDADKQVTFVELEGGNHNISNAKNRVKTLKVIDHFLKKHI
jgi:dipeptidyl aminopeptidase/acylaminoacyl peptidase